MADFSNIKQEVKSVIHDNQLGEITAEKLRDLELDIIDSIDTEKQDVISDLSEIRQNSSNAYQKPQSGIPSTDLASQILNSLGKADTALQQEDIAEIESVIPIEADKDNKLADKNYVDTNISTASATFRGTSAADLTEQQFFAWANALTKDKNDYVFWNTIDSDGDEIFKRYKWDGTQWSYEFTLSNTDKAILYKEQNLTDAQRLQALANVSNQEAGYDTSEEPPVFTGKMGYVVLQPEKTGDATTTFAAQIANKPNTIFEIRDVFDLGGTQETPVSVTIPKDCVLKFEGGSLKNGTLVGYRTEIKGSTKSVFYESLILAGSFSNKDFYLSWYKKEHDYNDSIRINRLTNNTICEKKNVYLDVSVVYITDSITLLSNVNLLGRGNNMEGTYLVSLSNSNIINIVDSSTRGLTIKNLLFDKATGNNDGHGIYCNFMLDHLTITTCAFSGFKASYSCLFFDTYSVTGQDNGVNALCIYNCKFSSNGKCLTMLQGGDNCNIRDNNFTGYEGVINWSGISGTASLNIENNSIVGGGDSLLNISNIGTLTIRNNQIECSRAINNGRACIRIGQHTFRNYCTNLEISHNNINLKTGLTDPATDKAISLNHVYGAFIVNNTYSYATTSVYGKLDDGTNASYDCVLVINLVYSGFTSTLSSSVVDPLYRMVTLNTRSKLISIPGYFLQFTNTGVTTTQPGTIGVSSSNPARFVTYNAAVGTNCDLSGFPADRCGTTIDRTATSLPDYIRGITGGHGGVNEKRLLGFEYFDTTLNKPLFLSGGGPDWVEADGAKDGVKRSGAFSAKPSGSDIYVGFRYFCTDKQTTEGATNGIEIIYKGQNTTDPANSVDIWVDALGRVVS